MSAHSNIYRLAVLRVASVPRAPRGVQRIAAYMAVGVLIAVVWIMLSVAAHSAGCQSSKDSDYCNRPALHTDLAAMTLVYVQHCGNAGSLPPGAVEATRKAVQDFGEAAVQETYNLIMRGGKPDQELCGLLKGSIGTKMKYFAQ